LAGQHVLQGLQQGSQVLHGLLITTGHAAPVKHGLQVLHGWLITTGHAAPVAHGLQVLHKGAQGETGIATVCTLGKHVGQVLQGHIASAGAEIKANKPNIARYFFIRKSPFSRYLLLNFGVHVFYNSIKRKLDSQNC